MFNNIISSILLSEVLVSPYQGEISLSDEFLAESATKKENVRE